MPRIGGLYDFKDMLLPNLQALRKGPSTSNICLVLAAFAQGASFFREDITLLDNKLQGTLTG